MNNPMNVIIRKGNLGENDIVVFDLDVECNLNMIWCIDQNGGGEACMEYYDNTIPVTPAEEAEAIQMIQRNYGIEDIKIAKRLTIQRKHTIWNWN